MENANSNHRATLGKSDRRHVEFGDIRTGKERFSLRRHRGAIIADKDMDKELERIEMELKEMDDLDDIFNYDNDGTESVSRESDKRRSLGTLQRRREELRLIAQNIELDEEAAELDEYVDAMEQNFVIMLANLTQRQINARREEKKTVDLLELNRMLKLKDHPHIEWAGMIQAAVAQLIA